MSQTTTITLLTEDYAERLSDLRAAFERAREEEAEARESNTLLGGEESAAEELAREFNELNEEAKKASAKAKRVITLEAVARKVWRELKEKHPPRAEGDSVVVKADRFAGLNIDTVEDDLTHASIKAPTAVSCAKDQDHEEGRIGRPACTPKNPCSRRKAYEAWADSLSSAEFNRVLNDSWALANVVTHAPKSLDFSPTRMSGATFE